MPKQLLAALPRLTHANEGHSAIGGKLHGRIVISKAPLYIAHYTAGSMLRCRLLYLCLHPTCRKEQRA